MAKNYFRISYDNPLSIRLDGVKRGLIKEGLYKTYPIKKVIEYIRKMFSLNNKQFFKVRDKSKVSVLIAVIPNDDVLKDNITKAMNLCGYFLSLTKHHANNIVTLQFEPIHQNSINSEIRNMTTLYHATPSYNKDKILKNGLSPKAKNELFKYPDRVYLFKEKSKLMELINLLEGLNLFLKNKRNDDKYTIFSIDVSKIPSYVDFYTDTNMTNACFTTDNIPPSAINGQKTIDINDYI